MQGVGLSFHQPSPPPVRFPSFRFVSNLEWRFWPRAREEREERKGKWRSRRAQRPPLPCSIRDFGGRRGNAETMLSISPSKIFRSKKSLFCVSGTTSFSPPARSSSRGWIFFYQGLDSVGGRAGRPFERYPKGWSVRGRGWLQLISTPSLTPPLVAWKHEHGDDGLQTRRKSKKSKKKKKREVE